MNRQQGRLELESRVRQAERRHMCLVASDRPEAKRFTRAAEAGKLIMPMPRLFVRPEYWEILDDADRVLHCVRALQKLHPNWVFVGPTAGMIYGLEVPDSYLWPIRIAARWGSRGRSTPQLLRQVVEGDDVTVIDHLRVTSLERTAFDCMREMTFADGLAVADSALAASGITRDQMIIRMNQFRRTSRGGRHAMEAASCADGDARGGDESRVRAAIIQLGYQVPQLHVSVPYNDVATTQGEFGWQLEDGTWIIGQLQGPRAVAGRVVEDPPNVHVMRFAAADTEDLDAFKQLLDSFGVPKAAEPVQVGVAKAFKPTRRSIENALQGEDVDVADDEDFDDEFDDELEDDELDDDALDD